MSVTFNSIYLLDIHGLWLLSESKSLKFINYILFLFSQNQNETEIMLAVLTLFSLVKLTLS